MSTKTALLIACAFASAGAAQAGELYSNGPVVNSQGFSVVTTPGTYGILSSATAGAAVADDFTSTSAWTLTDIDLFAYQTGATSFTFTSVDWSIVQGGRTPNGQVIASGTSSVTNGGLVGYRVSDQIPGDTTRAIYDIKADISDVHLEAGQYWLTWSLTGDSAVGGPFQPSTSDNTGGNAFRTSGPGTPFTRFTDTSSARTATLPFQLNGFVTAVPEPATTWMFLAGLSCLVGLGRRGARVSRGAAPAPAARG